MDNDLLSECACSQLVWNASESDSDDVGIDMTNNRYGEVRILTCKTCRQKWVEYFVEYEHYSRSGRWFRGQIADAEVTNITPENAVAYLESLEWYVRGGSFFETNGVYHSGTVRADP